MRAISVSIIRRGTLAAACGLLGVVSAASLPNRTIVSLDGVWEAEESRQCEKPPATYGHRAPVPGLLDLAEPAFSRVGFAEGLPRYFWHRRRFVTPKAEAAAAELKFHKVKYGAAVYLNGRFLGRRLACFTPAIWDVTDALRPPGKTNELVVCVGGHREMLSTNLPTGWDFEKYRYIPGIYDSVELILSGLPRIANVQAAPDLPGRRVRAAVWLRAGGESCPSRLSFVVKEAASGRIAGRAEIESTPLRPREVRKLEATIPIAECRPWTPERPFLYRLEVRSAGDAYACRFGMRSFRFDPETGRAILNGKPYYLRGSNVTLYRFFEDAARGKLPWNRAWVRALHRKFKSMHWNALRYCIGFPPDFWYDIADEEGVLIQDEFPVWLLSGAPERPAAEALIPQYAAWMRERWNHPSVAIWDAQNESVTPETGKALTAVRGLDLSNRPWENGWAGPQSPIDCVEAHPYLWIADWQKRGPFKLSKLAELSGRPWLNPAQRRFHVPVLINEYAWLWITREGEPTCLTREVYANLLGPEATKAQRRELYARYTAALTEFWRCHRQAAGVLHFCGLGYSRPGDKPRPVGGATSDAFLDVRRLVMEPRFEERVRDAFSPVGLMVDFWDEEAPAGAKRRVQVYVINDLEREWAGAVRLEFLREGRAVSGESQPACVAPWGREVLDFETSFPKEPGLYELRASLLRADGKPVRSRRQVLIRR